MKYQILLKRLAATGLATMMLAAACTPGGTATTPLATDSNLGTSVVSSPVATMAATEDNLATEVSTEDTMVATAAETEMATQLATAESTAMDTAVGTPVGTAEATNQPAVLLSTELIGSLVVDNTGAEIGEVQELLVDNAGVVQYVIFDAAEYLDARGTAATPAADTTPEATPANATDTNLDTGVLAAPLANFQVNQTADEDDAHVLMYTGTADTLMGMGAFDTTLLDEDGFLINSANSDVAANITYDGLIRVSKFSDFDLKNADGDDLGEVEDLIVDVNTGLVAYGVVDFGGFLGIAEQTTAVPWDMFTVQTTGDEPNFMLEVNSDMLQNAPTIDLGVWPTWFERVDGMGDWTLDWDNQIRTFWNGAASS